MVIFLVASIFYTCFYRQAEWNLSCHQTLEVCTMLVRTCALQSQPNYKHLEMVRAEQTGKSQKPLLFELLKDSLTAKKELIACCIALSKRNYFWHTHLWSYPWAEMTENKLKGPRLLWTFINDIGFCMEGKQSKSKCQNKYIWFPGEPTNTHKACKAVRNMWEKWLIIHPVLWERDKKGWVNESGASSIQSRFKTFSLSNI